MQKPVDFRKDTNAWIVQVWAAFLISVSATGIGIVYMPVDAWAKGFLGIGFVFSLSSSFTLAKTVRDNQEASRLIAKIEEARVEKILAEHSPLK